MLEVPGPWPRDVMAEAGEALGHEAGRAISAWLEREPGRRALFVRRGRRMPGSSLAFVVGADESTAQVRRIELESPAGVATADLESGGVVVDAPLVLVCGHGSRDACCALRGTAVAHALAGTLGADELWTSSHHGGHRFAANVLVLPAGLQFGRVEPEDAADVVGRALAGQIALDRYRGRTCYTPVVQAAEHAIRTARALGGIGDLRLARVDGSTVTFRGSEGDELVGVVEEAVGPAVPASCGDAPEPQTALVGRMV